MVVRHRNKGLESLVVFDDVNRDKLIVRNYIEVNIKIWIFKIPTNKR